MLIPADEEKCLERRQGLGSSEIAAVLNLSPFLDPWELWAQKTGLIGEHAGEEISERMRGGTHLQRGIAEWFGERMGMKIRWWDRPITHPKRPWQLATPDAFIEHDSILEVKNIALDQAGGWSRELSDVEGVPEYYAVQAHWQMSVTRREVCWVAALIGGNDLRAYRLEHDPQVEADLLRAGERFWFDHIIAGVPPPMGASGAARQWLHARYPRQRTDLRRAQDEEVVMLEEYAQVRAELKPLSERKEALELSLKASVGEAEGLWWERGKFTWKRTKDSMTVQWKDLAQKLLAPYEPGERQNLVLAFTHPEEGIRRIDFRLKSDFSREITPEKETK